MKKVITRLLTITFLLGVAFGLNAENTQAQIIGVGGEYLSSAANFTIGDSIQGKMPSDSYYKFTITKKCIINFYLATYLHDDALGLEIYDSTGDNITKRESTDDSNNFGYQKLSYSIALPAGTYYLGISHPYWNNTISGYLNSKVIRYEDSNIKVGTFANDYLSKAVSFKPGNALMGTLASASGAWSDVNYFKFYLNQRTMFLCVAGSEEVGWMKLYDSKGNRIYYKNVDSKEHKYIIKALNKGTYYIGLESTYSGFGTYVVTTGTYRPAGANLKNVSTKKCSITAYLSSSQKYTAKYQVQVSRYKNFKSAKSVTSYSKTITIKNLTKKKYYYVRSRAWHTELGIGIEGSWSNVRRIKVKK